MPQSTAAGALIAGAVIFLVGAAITVPRVFTEPDLEVRRQLLEERIGWWRLGQPLYALGALVAALGVGTLACASPTASRLGLAASGGLLLTGALAWSWSVYQRAVRPRAFALGQLPGWPFATYVWFTLAGLVLLAAGLLLGDQPPWLGWFTLLCDALFATFYIRTGDIPPFVFYLLFLVVGVTLA